jgi:hypothetical protein
MESRERREQTTGLDTAGGGNGLEKSIYIVLERRYSVP